MVRQPRVRFKSADARSSGTHRSQQLALYYLMPIIRRNAGAALLRAA